MKTAKYQSIYETQALQLAGKEKLTAVSLLYNREHRTYFTSLKHNSKGNPVLPYVDLNVMLKFLGVKAGDTFTSG